jgi:hypothetical protein
MGLRCAPPRYCCHRFITPKAKQFGLVRPHSEFHPEAPRNARKYTSSHSFIPTQQLNVRLSLKLDAVRSLPIAVICHPKIVHSRRFPRLSARKLATRPSNLPRFIVLGIMVLTTIASGTLLAQTPMTVFGDGTPSVPDAGVNQSIVVGVKIFSDVPGQVLGCSFYKAPANVGTHVVSLWDAAGKLLATQMATAETASGKQSVQFSIPVPIAATQTFTCGYLALAGHFSSDKSTFAVQKDAPPLHVPAQGGVYVYAWRVPGRPTTTPLEPTTG